MESGSSPSMMWRYNSPTPSEETGVARGCARFSWLCRVRVLPVVTALWWRWRRRLVARTRPRDTPLLPCAGNASVQTEHSGRCRCRRGDGVAPRRLRRLLYVHVAMLMLADLLLGRSVLADSACMRVLPNDIRFCGCRSRPQKCSASCFSIRACNGRERLTTLREITANEKLEDARKIACAVNKVLAFVADQSVLRVP